MISTILCQMNNQIWNLISVQFLKNVNWRSDYCSKWSKLVINKEIYPFYFQCCHGNICQNSASKGLNQIYNVWLSTTYLNFTERVCAQVCFLLECSLCKALLGHPGVTYRYDPLEVDSYAEAHTQASSSITRRGAERRRKKIQSSPLKSFCLSLSLVGSEYGGLRRPRRWGTELGSRHPKTAGFRNPCSLSAPSVSLASPSSHYHPPLI